MDATVAGFIGGVIGAGASLIGLWMQQLHQTKRDRVKIASELGLAEYQRDLELAREAGRGVVAPLASYVISSQRLLEVLEGGSISTEKVKSLIEERDKLLAAFPAPRNNLRVQSPTLESLLSSCGAIKEALFNLGRNEEPR